ncbi:TetR-like C-terminal domain-containing protein [Streptomyces sp. NPDC018059]|uniref:TetR-like C-terminal domain-containing protein n=1 Tax=Streptomyces sp. NPDC018059 TaxID=3365041 RepID=UPI003790CDCA
MSERGYANLTVDSVARPVTPADTGSLRGDLIATLTEASEEQGLFLAQLSPLLAGYFTETGTSFAELRETIVAGRRSGRDEIMRRAVERGELDPTKLTPRIASRPR